MPLMVTSLSSEKMFFDCRSSSSCFSLLLLKLLHGRGVRPRPAVPGLRGLDQSLDRHVGRLLLPVVESVPFVNAGPRPLHEALREGSAAPGRRPRARALLLLHDALKTRVRLRHPALSGSMAPLVRSAALHAHGSHKLHSKSGSSGVGAAPLI